MFSLAFTGGQFVKCIVEGGFHIHEEMEVLLLSTMSGNTPAFTACGRGFIVQLRTGKTLISSM
jgi:hypothetical protein